MAAVQEQTRPDPAAQPLSTSTDSGTVPPRSVSSSAATSPRLNYTSSPTFSGSAMRTCTATEEDMTPRKNLDLLSRRAALQRPTDEERSPYQYGIPALQSSYKSHHKEHVDTDYNSPEALRRVSNISGSTMSLDFDAIPEYKYDGEDSDYGTLDGAESDTATPTKATFAEAMQKDRQTSESTIRPTDRSAAELSRRAELILANAKKRLNLMDQNLKGARALTAENLQRAASVNDHRTPYTSRYFGGQDAPRSPEISDLTTAGHARNWSDNTLLHRPIRSRLAMTGPSKPEGIGSYQPWKASPLRASKSQELPRSVPGLRSLRSKSRGDLRSTYHNPTSPDSALSEDARLGGHNSSPLTLELKQQVQNLNRRVSLLRDRTIEHNLRKQGSPLSRQPSVFTNAQQQPPQAVSPKSLQDSPGEAFEAHNADAAQKPGKRRARPSDWSPVTPVRSAQVSRFSADSALVQDEDDTIGSTSDSSFAAEHGTEEESEVHGAADAHEDRHDAFDYQHFFLHSALGRSGRVSRSNSEASNNTTRGPGLDSTSDVLEAADGAADPQNMDHPRLSSFDSVSTVNTFATASETADSRQASPTKREDGSDGADSGIGGIQDFKVKPGGNDHSLAVQIANIAAPPAAIAVEAVSTPDKRRLGSQDRAFVYMLMESTRKACERLQSDQLESSERMVLRRRLEEARKVMDGLAPVVS